MNGILKLGAIVLSVVIKAVAKNDAACSICDGSLQLINSAEDTFEKRKNVRSIEAITDQISESCQQILEHSSVNSDARREIIINTISKILDSSKITYDLLFINKINADGLCRLLSNNAKKYKVDFDPSEYEVIESLLHHISSVIITTAIECPEFVNQGIKHLTFSLSSLEEKIEDILAKVNDINEIVAKKALTNQKYERIYRQNIVERYGWIQLLGANSLSRIERKYQLSIAYVTLEMAQGNDSNIPVDIQYILKHFRTIWIQGDAGSGKTTFLQWIAIKSATNNFDELPQLEDTIPILVKLRSEDCKNLSLKHVVDTIMIDSNCAMPDNWLTKILETGQALILIDGIDEIEESDRYEVYDWIEAFYNKYKKVKIIVTSRPQVQDQLGIKYADIKILPMTRPKVEIFINYWHNAVLIDKLNIDKHEAAIYIQKLLLQIDKFDSIRRMISNPLLCAMVCALHYKNGSILSTQRNQLYEDCCKMLFDNRDTERDIPVFADFNLSYDEKKIILAQLAYWMMKNNLVVADIDDIIGCINRTLKGLRIDSQSLSGHKVFSYLLERSGVLRTPEEGKVDFIHKSFQEYLSAFEVHQEDDWGLIAEKSNDINWYETLILSMGFASTKQAEIVIRHIMGSDKCHKNIVIAAVCASNTTSLSPELRVQISKNIADIIPPKTIKDSEALSTAGEYVIPFLSFNSQYTDEESYLCLNALRLINSSKTLAIVASYLEPNICLKNILIIGKILTAYTDQEIQASGIENAISEYIKTKASGKSLDIPASFLGSLTSEYLVKVSDNLRAVTTLTIFDCFEDNQYTFIKYFKRLHTLTIVGSFESLPFFELLQQKLQSLSLCDTSQKFDMYSLNQYRFPNLKTFNYHTAKKVYINGNDLLFLSRIKNLGLFLYNDFSELIFDNFNNFAQLEELTVYTKFIDELGFSPLSNIESLKAVHLMVPTDYSSTSCNTIAHKFYGTGSCTVEYFDYPYGDLSTIITATYV